MNQNVSSFSCLKKWLLKWVSILSTHATSSSVCSTQCNKVGMNVLQIRACLTITNKSIIWCKKITLLLPTEKTYITNKLKIPLKDLSLLSEEHCVKVLKWIGSNLVMSPNELKYHMNTRLISGFSCCSRSLFTSIVNVTFILSIYTTASGKVCNVKCLR